MYRTSIILFGIAIPLFLLLLVIFGSFHVRGNFRKTLAEKQLYYSDFKNDQIAVSTIEATLKEKRQHYERWQTLVGQETFAQVTDYLRKVSKNIPSEEFESTGSERLESTTGLGSASLQKAAGIKFNFRGTFSRVQEVLLGLESQMPNLTLEQISVSPGGQSEFDLLNFQVIYTGWEK